MSSAPNVDLHDLQRVSEFINSCRQQTPREAYSLLRTNREKASFLVMMKMDAPTLALVRKEFSKQGDGVGLEEFCSIMVAYILEAPKDENSDGLSFGNTAMSPEERKAEFIANMIVCSGCCDVHGVAIGSSRIEEFAVWCQSATQELFSEVDVNGDGDMEWEEFTKFVVEKASIFRQRFAEDGSAEYHDTSHLLDPYAKTLRRHEIAAICVLPKTAELAVIEEHNPAVFISRYSTASKLQNILGRIVV
jgi:hypothetical protein